MELSVGYTGTCRGAWGFPMDFSHYKQAFSSSPEETCLLEQSQSLRQSQVTAGCPSSLRGQRCACWPLHKQGVFAASHTGAELNHLQFKAWTSLLWPCPLNLVGRLSICWAGWSFWAWFLNIYWVVYRDATALGLKVLIFRKMFPKWDNTKSSHLKLTWLKKQTPEISAFPRVSSLTCLNWVFFNDWNFHTFPWQGIFSPLLLPMSARHCGSFNVSLSFHQLFFLMKILS